MKVQGLHTISQQILKQLGLPYDQDTTFATEKQEAQKPTGDDICPSNVSANFCDKISVQDPTKDLDDNFSKQDFYSQDETFQASQQVTKFTLSEKHGLSAPLISQINVVAYENLKANLYCAKFQGVMGHEVYVKTLPSVCGSLPSTDKQPLAFLKDGSSEFPAKIFNVKEQARMLQREMLKQGGRFGPNKHQLYGCEFEDLMNMNLNHDQISKNSHLTFNGSKSQLKQLL